MSKSSGVVRVGVSMGLLLASALCVKPMLADGFVKPTAEELSMTSLPGYPGAPAVVLFQEESTTDKLHDHQIYRRVKILTEEGKKYANVELKFMRYDNIEGESNDANITDIQGRTIHSDGTIIPFTGKPYLKTIEDSKHFHYQARVFTLPDVEVGSIIEYKYVSRFTDSMVEAPDWYLQGDLYVKSAHYIWTPTTHELIDVDSQSPINSIAWFPILPAGAKIETRQSPLADSNMEKPTIYELHVHDIPPVDNEEFMPPVRGFTYRVLFSYTAFRNGDEFWKVKGKSWSKRSDSFIGPNAELRAETAKTTAGATTDDEKLHKIYAAVMAVENTSYTRDHAQEEDKAAGLKKVTNAADVLANKRGSGDQINSLFIGMARAAGMKAYRMVVTSRGDSLFAQGWLSFNQLNSDLAIVTVDGKDIYFDPGARYCEYGQLTWGDTNTEGIRQTDNGVVFAKTPNTPYVANFTGRAANLHMDEHGVVSGSVVLSMKGSPALEWRRRALTGDEESVHSELRKHMEAMLPKTLEVKVIDVKNVASYDQPLIVDYSVNGTIGEPTGKRLIVPVDLFVARDGAAFPHEKRTNGVYFEYPQAEQDAVRIFLPKTIEVEAAPQGASVPLKDMGLYKLDVQQVPGVITVRRNYGFNTIFVPVAEYPDLRGFYSKFEAMDHQSLVFKQAAVPAAASPAGQ